jgi:hypothetical protein
MYRRRLSLAQILILVCSFAAAGTAVAHWCSNIFVASARMVVKPEKTTVNVSGTTTLKVYLQNNFPYSLSQVKMRGQASGYTISVSPTSTTVHAGQKVEYTFTIQGSGNLTTSQMNLQVQIRNGDHTWDSSDWQVDQNPSQADLIKGSSYHASLADQVPSLNAATLADRFPSATLGSGTPFFGRTGMQQIIHWFGYRHCYNTDGDWRCGSQDCPSPCSIQSSWQWTATDQFPQNCMRAGVEVGIRRAALGSDLQLARDAAVAAMQGNGSVQHKCLAAVVGGHLWNGAQSTTPFESALNNVSSQCKAAGLRALGKGSSSSCGSGSDAEKAACAAAEGLRGNDAPVKSVLMANAGDGETKGGYKGLYYAYMLYLVTGDRYAQGKNPSYYPTVGPPPQQDQGTTPPKTDQGTTPPIPDFGGPPPDGWTPPEGPPPQSDMSVIYTEAGPVLRSTSTLEGGCAVGKRRGSPLGLLLVVVGLVLFLRRRRA